MGANALWRGNHQEARGHFEQALILDPGYVVSRVYMTEVYLAQGQPEAALREALGRMRGEFGRALYQEAIIYAALGETSRALDLLKESRLRSSNLKVGLYWKPLRGEPRYQRLLEEMGLDDASIRETMDRLAEETRR